MNKKKIVSIILAICSVAIGMFWGNEWLIQSETKEFVKDEHNNRKLIEYFNVDTNELHLKLIEDGNSEWIKHPNCCMEYDGHILSNEIKFDRNDHNSLLVNGQVFPIERKE